MNEVEKTLLDLANEPDAAKFKEGFSKLSDEDKTKVNQVLADRAAKLKADGDAELARVDALKKEGQRVEDRNQNQNKTFEQKLHDETVEEGLNAVFKELGIDKDEEKNRIKEMHKKLDDGSTRLENVIKNIRAAAVAANPEKYTGAIKRIKDLESGAADFNRGNADNIGGSGEPVDDDGKVSAEAKRLSQQSQNTKWPVTPEQAQAYIDGGGLRGNRSFALGGKKKS